LAIHGPTACLATKDENELKAKSLMLVRILMLMDQIFQPNFEKLVLTAGFSVPASFIENL